MAYYMVSDSELYHYGIKGMRWGVRRYQNPDGTLTNAGIKRYRGDRTKATYDTLEKNAKDVRGHEEFKFSVGNAERWLKDDKYVSNKKKLENVTDTRHMTPEQEKMADENYQIMREAQKYIVNSMNKELGSYRYNELVGRKNKKTSAQWEYGKQVMQDLISRGVDAEDADMVVWLSTQITDFDWEEEPLRYKKG